MNDDSTSRISPEDHPLWMDDPSIAYIPREKIAFLSKLMTGTKDLSKNEMMQYIPRLAMEAKAQHIQFTRGEMADMINAIKKYSPENERQVIDKVLSSNKPPHPG